MAGVQIWNQKIIHQSLIAVMRKMILGQWKQSISLEKTAWFVRGYDGRETYLKFCNMDQLNYSKFIKDENNEKCNQIDLE